MTQICFCADDFALNPAVSLGIVDLIALGRLHATSCMTQAADWSVMGQQLKPFHHQVDIGLHFNLTHDFGQAEYNAPLGTLMFSAWIRRLDPQQTLQSLQIQWDRFIEVMGFAPDFIDGHQHVHQFPVIRETLIHFLKQQDYQGWVRSLSHTIKTSNYFLKSSLLPYLGASRLQQLCDAQGLQTNAQFAGIYDFSTTSYQTLVNSWFKQSNNATLIMCHPARVNDHTPDDVIAQARNNEYQYLSSEQFLLDYADHQITLARLGAR